MLTLLIVGSFVDLNLYQAPIRFTVAAVALVTLWAWIGSAVHRWHEFPARSQRVTIVIGCLLFSISYGLSEAALQGAPIGPRVLIIGAVLLWLFVTLTFRWNEQNGAPKTRR